MRIERASWLSGCRSSVAEHWLHKPGVWVRFPATTLKTFKGLYETKCSLIVNNLWLKNFEHFIRPKWRLFKIGRGTVESACFSLIPRPLSGPGNEACFSNVGYSNIAYQRYVQVTNFPMMPCMLKGIIDQPLMLTQSFNKIVSISVISWIISCLLIPNHRGKFLFVNT